MTVFEEVLEQLKTERKTWLVTGNAGFIGSNLTEFLLNHNQRVVGLDNFSTGYRHNIDVTINHNKERETLMRCPLSTGNQYTTISGATSAKKTQTYPKRSRWSTILRCTTSSSGWGKPFIGIPRTLVILMNNGFERISVA